MLRMLQGFAVSGEHSGATALALELSSENRRAFYASFSLSGTQVGFILSSVVYLVLSYFLKEVELAIWGWRIPFLLSFCLVAMGAWVRFRLPESPAFLSEENRGDNEFRPLKLLWSQYKRDVLRVVLAAQISVVSTIFGVFSFSWAINNTRISQNAMLGIMLSNAVVGMVLVPVWAYLSDHIGRRPVFLLGAVGSGILIWPYFWALGHSNVPLAFIFGVLLSGVAYSAANGVWPALYGELFCTRIRLSGMAIGTQIGFMLAAQAPAVATLLIQQSPVDWSPAPLLVNACCAVSALVVFFFPETFQSPLKNLGNRNPKR